MILAYAVNEFENVIYTKLCWDRQSADTQEIEIISHVQSANLIYN